MAIEYDRFVDLSLVKDCVATAKLDSIDTKVPSLGENRPSLWQIQIDN